MRAPGSPPCHVRHVPVLAIRRYASRSIAVNRGDLEIDSFAVRRSIVGRMQTPLDPIPPSVAHALLTAHLLVWTVLALYGLHRLHLLRLFRGRDRGPDQNSPPAESADPPVEWPRVTIQLPVYNERYVVERLLDAAAAVEYPRDLVRPGSPTRTGGSRPAGRAQWATRNTTAHDSVVVPGAVYEWPGALGADTRIRLRDFVRGIDHLLPRG